MQVHFGHLEFILKMQINYAYASGGAWDVTIVGTTTLTLNAWNHIAFVRYKTTFIHL